MSKMSMDVVDMRMNVRYNVENEQGGTENGR